jgi:hypothetical protein
LAPYIKLSEVFNPVFKLTKTSKLQSKWSILMHLLALRLWIGMDMPKNIIRCMDGL